MATTGKPPASTITPFVASADASLLSYTPPGVGAVATTGAAELNRLINATDYGGNTTASFNAAVTYANSVGGGLIFRPNGPTTAAPSNSVTTAFVGSGSTTATAIAISQNAVVFETQIGRPSQILAGLYNTKVTSQYIFGASFDGTEQAQATGPAICMTAIAENTGSLAQAVAFHGIGYANGASRTVFGGNFIAGCSPSATNTKLIGFEIDVEPSVGATVTAAGSGGLFLNVFNIPALCVGIQLGGVSTGTWTNGILIGGVASTGAGVAAQAGTMDSFVNTSNGTFNSSAILLGNTHRVRFSGTSTTHGFMFMDGSNNLQIVNGGASIVFMESSGVTVMGSFDNAGNLNVIGSYQFNGTKVVGAQITGYGTPTGGVNQGSFAAGGITLANLAAGVAQLILDLKTHGLLGT